VAVSSCRLASFGEVQFRGDGVLDVTQTINVGMGIRVGTGRKDERSRSVRVVTVVGVEGGGAGGRVNRVVVCKLSQG